MNTTDKTKKELLQEIKALKQILNGPISEDFNFDIGELNFFEEIGKLSDQGVILIQLDKIVYANDQFYEFTGYSKTELLGRLFINFVEKESLSQVLKSYTDKLNGVKNKNSYNSGVICKNGKVMPLQIQSFLTVYKNKKAVLLFTKDNSELKLVSHKLKETNTILQESEKISKTGTVKLNLETFKLSCTDNTYRLLGVDKSTFELTIDNIGQLIHPDDFAMANVWYVNACKNIIQPACTIRIIKQNGQIAYLKNEYNYLNQCEFHENCIVSIVQDVTDQITSDRLISKREEEFRLLFENNPSPMWIYEPNTLAFIEINNAAVLKYGYSRNEFLSMSIFDIRPESEHKRLEQNLKQGRETHLEYGEWVHAHKNGQLIHVQVTSHSIDYNGEPAILVTVNDITALVLERKRILKSEQEYRLFYENSFDGIYKSVFKGKFVDVNKALVDLLGYDSKEELLNIDLNTQLYDSEDQRDNVQDEFVDGEKCRYRLKRKDGTKIWVEDLGYNEYDEFGNIIFQRGSLRDITTEVFLENQLRDSEINLIKEMNFTTELIDNIPGIFYVCEIQEKNVNLIQWNGNLEKVTGYTKEELRNRSVFDLIHEEDMPKAIEALSKLEVLDTTQVTIKLVLKDNSTIPYRFTSQILKRSNKTFAIGNGIDISLRQKAEMELRQSEEKFRLISSSASEGIILIDHNSKITFWNNAAAYIFGYSKDEAIGKMVNDLFDFNFNDNNNSLQTLKLDSDDAEQKDQGIAIINGLKKNGEKIIVEISTSTFKIENKWHSAATVRDITEQEENKRVKINLLKELEERNRSYSMINKALTGFIDNSTPLAFYNRLLGKIINETGSGFGFFGTVEHIKGQQQYIINAISDVALDKMSYKVREDLKNEESVIINELDFLYAESLESKKVHINNSVQQSKSLIKKDFLNGLPMIKTFMSIPLINQDDLIGIVIIINKEHGYTNKDVESIQPYLNIGNTLIKQSKEEAYRKELQLQTQTIAHELRQFIETANAPIFGIDSNGLVNEWNQTSEVITGYKKQEVMGKDLVQNYITEDYRKAVQEVLDNALQGKETANYEFPLFTKNGDRVMVLLNSSTRRDSNGNIVGVLGVGQDITEIDRLRTVTMNIAQELRQFIETANAPIFGIDGNGLVNEWNQTSEVITGYKKQEVMGKDLVQNYITEDYRKAVQEVLDNALQGKETSNYEFPLFTKNGDRVIVLLNSSTRRDANGNIVGVLGVGQDITELVGYRNELEAKVIQRTKKINNALRKEKELNELKSRFVSIASHEFRTPLSAINFAAGSIKKYWDRMDPEVVQKKLHKIEDQVSHMTKLLDDVLIVGQADARKFRNNPVKTDLGTFLSTIIDEVSSATGKSHEIKLEDPGSLMDSTIYIDEKLGRNVFVNLIGNAIKFSPGVDYIVIGLFREEDKIGISITDYGIGILKSEQKNIFTPFTRGKNVDLIQGTGLGLSIVKEAVDVIQGTIDVISKKGKGSTFTVKLPNKPNNE